MFHHFFIFSADMLKYMVGLSYFLWFVGLIWMVVQGFKQKSYGMPPIGTAAMLGICVIAVVGPYIEPHLFYDPAENPALPIIWTAWGILVGIVYVQYIMYGKNHPARILEFKKNFYAIAIGTLIVMTAIDWTFIVFYQDYYVNVSCALFAVLPMSVGWFASLYTRPKLRGLSVTVAWLFTIGTALLYIAIMLGDMSDPFRGHSDTGYGFPILIMVLTMFLNVWYAITLTRRRRELKEDWDPQVTLNRMNGLSDDGTTRLVS